MTKKQLIELWNSLDDDSEIEIPYASYKENEDEKIREGIIKYLEQSQFGEEHYCVDDDVVRDYIAWLEKQGKNNMGISEVTKQELEDSLNKTLEKETPESCNEFLDKQGEPTEINPSEFDSRLNRLLGQFETLPKEELASSLSFYLNVVQNDGTYKDEEKQGEQNPADNEPKFKAGDTIRLKNGDGLEWTVEKVFNNGYYIIVCADRNDFIQLDDNWELVEQKPSDKVESKFKVGDWIVSNMNKDIFLIKSVNNGYCTLEDAKSRVYSPCLPPTEDDYHLWTIEDAKDGDVLTYRDMQLVFIFKKMTDNTTFKYHALISEKGLAINDSAYTALPSCIVPATKEQRDALMKAMTDAGYTFDFEKKELKKIVVPKFNVHDCVIKKHNSNINDFGSFVITDISGGKYWYNDRIICDIVEQDEWEIYEPIRQKLAWSEEDERMFDYALDMIEWYSGKNKNKSRLVSSWIKSIKNRVQPK